MNQKLIYIVDDEKELCKLVSLELTRFGHEVKAFHTGTRVMEAIKHKKPDACIIDLGLPDMDGLGLVGFLLDACETGVIILSGRKSQQDKILGLELGADDYISKPFDPRELVARTNSVLRRIEKIRSQPMPSNLPKRAHFSDWTFDTGTLVLSHTDGRLETLSASEAGLFVTLLQAPKQILARDQLIKDRENVFDRCIDVRMSRIRKKLEEDPKFPILIKTVYGAGYIFTPSVDWAQE